MELTDIRQLKKETENKIVQLLATFNEKTGLEVKAIDYNFIRVLDGNSPIIPFSLKLKIDL